MTMNDSWGYNPDDAHYKSARRLIHTISEVAGKSGNLLLNVSPRGDGSLPPEQVERLQAVAAWMQANGDAVTGTTAGLEAHQFYGPTTRRDDTIYLHLLMRPYSSVDVRDVPVKRVKRVYDVATGRDLRFSTRTGIIESVMPDPPGTVTITVPEDVVGEQSTVVALELG